MPKNIVLLSDGTGNSAAKLSRTNVWRLYQSLDLRDAARQVAYYDDGVGTSSFKPLRWVGGAFGYGLKNNVLDLYRFACRHYQPGDQIYCFGFSRGAFTAGVLTALIVHEGLVPFDTGSGEAEERLHKLSKWAFREYRKKRYHAKFRTDKLGRWVRDLFLWRDHQRYQENAGKNRDVTVEFLGMWDTVAAYGMPIDEMSRALNWVWPIQPRNNAPVPRVKRTRHAVGLDDERDTFHPRLFDEATLPENATSARIEDETVSQVWFSGVHSNVGGGYPDDSLSLIPFEWIVQDAEKHGLVLKADWMKDCGVNPGATGRVYDSRRGLGGFYRYRPRRMQGLIHQTKWDGSKKVWIPRPKIHESVFERIKADAEYAPLVIPEDYAVVSRKGDITTLGSANMPETADQAKQRVEGWETTWNLVWWKRGVYFASVASVARLGLAPVWPLDGHRWDPKFQPVSDLVGLIGNVLPGFVSGWLIEWQATPFYFSVFLGLYCLFLWGGHRLQKWVQDEARASWCGLAPKPAGVMRRLFDAVPAHLRKNKLYIAGWRVMKEAILPAITLLASVGLSVWAVRVGLQRFGYLP